MKVVDIVNVTGRGWVVVCDEDNELICGDVICVKDREFTIKEVEKATNLSQVGFVLSPNDKVKDSIVVGDTISLRHLYGRHKIIEAEISVHFQEPQIASILGVIRRIKLITSTNLEFFERTGTCYVRVARKDYHEFGYFIPIKEKFDELESLIKKE